MKIIIMIIKVITDANLWRSQIWKFFLFRSAGPPPPKKKLIFYLDPLSPPPPEQFCRKNTDLSVGTSIG